MNGYLIPLLSAAVGALFGVLSNFLTSSLRQRQDITSRLVDQYFDVRREVVNAVSELSDLDLKTPLDLKYRNGHRDVMSKLFYRHYDFLPKPVLDSLILLHVCLERSNGMLYSLRDGAVIQMDDHHVMPFVESCAIFTNSKYLAALALKSDNVTVRTNQAIVLHARHVLYSLNEFVSIGDLVEMTKNLKKARSLKVAPPNSSKKRALRGV
jgi:hypothetical protein